MDPIKKEPAKNKAFASTLATGIDYETRTLYLVGEIDEKSAYHFISAILFFDKTPGDIKIIMSSPGGVEFYGYAMYDVLRTVKNNVIAEGYGVVASMAAAIFQGADVRYLSENCEYLIHNGSLQIGSENIEQDEILSLADQIKINAKKYYQILFDNSNLTMEEVAKYCKDEKSFNSTECLQAGLADFIIKPNKGNKVRKVTKKKRKQ